VLGVSSSLTGFAMDNMTRDDGWRFLIIGRRLERLSFLANTVANFLRMPSTRGPGCLEWLLELADSIITYRSRYSRLPELLPVLDLLVFDDSNPHGVIFQASVLARYLDRMARELDETSESKLPEVLSRLRAFDLESLEHLQFSECHVCAPCEKLAALLKELDAAVGQLSDWLGMRYFTHVAMSAGRRWRCDHGKHAVRYHVLHETRYDYGSSVSLSQQQLHLSPRILAWQQIEEQRIDIDPPPTWRRDGQDAFGNPVTWIAFHAPHDSLIHPFGDDHRRDAAPARAMEPRCPGKGARPPGLRCLAPRRKISMRCVFCSRARMSASSTSWQTYAADCFPPGRPVLIGAQALMAKIFKEFKFDPEATTVSTPVMEVLEKKRGVCQDFAHLMIACLRALGLAARYVSGYLLTRPPPGKPRLIGADASHAWVSVYAPGFANDWVDFDPTNNLLPEYRTHHGRHRPRFRRHLAAARHHPRRRRCRAGGRGDGDAAR
jgi:transglutaminase-like putative cysteine protease